MLVDRRLFLMYRRQKSMIMLISRPPFSEAFGVRKYLRHNTAQRCTVLLVTAYSHSLIKLFFFT